LTMAGRVILWSVMNRPSCGSRGRSASTPLGRSPRRRHLSFQPHPLWRSPGGEGADPNHQGERESKPVGLTHNAALE
jgi:hypothetical protein